MREGKNKNMNTMTGKRKAIILAFLAAVFYAVNTPFSKMLLKNVPSTFMAGFLYIGAGIGVGIMYVFNFKKEDKAERLTKDDLPYTIGMIVLDILAPVFLMAGIKYGSAASASLLGNFEIVATTLIALVFFKEAVTKRLWCGIGLILTASIFLSVEGTGRFQFSFGSFFVLLAACCWGLENNCTRKISEKSTYEIVVLKGFFSGGGSVVIAFIIGEQIPQMQYIFMAMLLGFVAYGLSIFMYIRAQRDLGAAKTSAYYAVAPFVGSFLAFLLLGEKIRMNYLIGLIFMAAGSAVVAADTLIRHHIHPHEHVITHEHDGYVHTHVITHEHEHDHYSIRDEHRHHHSKRELDADLLKVHSALHAKA